MDEVRRVGLAGGCCDRPFALCPYNQGMIFWGILLVLVVAACPLVWLYVRMTPMQRLAYRMSVRASLPGGPRCRECGNRAQSADFPFCSDEHADQHAASTAW